jgi:hypothetical protein
MRLEFIGCIKDKIDILQVSAGLHDTQGIPEHMKPMIRPYTQKQMCNVDWAGQIKAKYPNLLVSVVGSIKSVAQAEEIIASGKADFVAFMRGLIADPEMPRKYASGREWEHMPCLRCQCIKIDKNGKFSGPCSVNPMASYYNECPDFRVPPAAVRKKAGVIGGGPAGVQAVKTLLERGHSVTLYEKTGSIGGQVKLAKEPFYKEDMRQYFDYLRGFIENSDLTNSDLTVYGLEATPENIAAHGFDALVVAIGAAPHKPRGLEKYEWVADYRGGAKNIVIVGAGAVGIECAVDLAYKGAKVTILEAAPNHGLGPDMSPLGGGRDLLDRCEELGVDMIFNVGDAEARIAEIAPEVVLLACGMTPLTQQARAFQNAAPNTEVFLIGDCKAVGDIRDATRSAFEICREI